MSIKQCSMPDCTSSPRAGQRYCGPCHRVYMKVWRAKKRREDLKLRESVRKLRQKVVLQQQELSELKENG